ncbi:hypothetical protein L6258_00260 [Candidatus Parcubacteria bacterium]|nr:hypothetical protein [Candidatus Parcubacteria bacterium]
MRKIILVTDRIYHVYNRGVEKRDIFPSPDDYSRFISILDHHLKYAYPYSVLKHRLGKAQSPEARREILLQLELKRIEPPVAIISFCLMPNHYHLTLKQLVENGVTDFMHRMGTSYTGYFNLRRERTGRLFDSPFKTALVKSEEQLLYLTRYQHINPRVLGLKTSGEFVDYPWSSLSTYLGGERFPFVKPEVVMSTFAKPEGYLDFVSAKIDEFEPPRLQKIAIDDDFGWFAEFRALEKDRREQLRDRYLSTLG